ncbi:TrmH family RNA methyltransferase [Ammoniphilus sp. 3BR4]|uniref:TrmH family RNA methyltransferase n=1 Tax=Ammoniphilus sp. 3BR4 TaxID=3158265 RepID=UPI0034669693
MWETIQSVQNTKVKEWAKLSTKKGREKEGAFLIEGPHLVEEALKSGADVRVILIEEGYSLPSGLEQSISDFQGLIYRISEPVAKKLSETENQQGVFAVVEISSSSLDELLVGTPILLLLDAVQDPGNLGTIIRTADAAGIQGVIMGKGTVDLYNAKTVRSTMGSIFHIPIFQADLELLCSKLASQDFRLIATSLEGAVAYDEPIYEGRVAIIIGNEANGVSSEVLRHCKNRVKIPIYGQAESLNAAMAAGIIMYEAVRQRK